MVQMSADGGGVGVGVGVGSCGGGSAAVGLRLPCCVTVAPDTEPASLIVEPAISSTAPVVNILPLLLIVSVSLELPVDAACKVILPLLDPMLPSTVKGPRLVKVVTPRSLLTVPSTSKVNAPLLSTTTLPVLAPLWEIR